MTAIVAVLIVQSLSAQAQPAPDETRQSALQQIARQFKNRIGGSLDEANSALDPSQAATRKTHAAFDAIPDDELMMLATDLREAQSPGKTRYSVKEPITAIKRGYDMHISLSDFVYIAGLAIKVDPDTATASGWYNHPENIFALDARAGKVSLAGEDSTFPPSAIIEENGDLYVQSALLEQWFNLDMSSEPRRQALHITTTEQLPLQARLERLKKKDQQRRRKPPEKPRIEEEFHAVTVPRADVIITSQAGHNGSDTDAEATQSTRYSVLTNNQLLGHEMTGYFAGTVHTNKSGEPVDQVRIGFRKESENNDLLGPLAAKVYEFNDIATSLVPGTGGNATERGVRVSNQSSRYSIDTETTIDGDGQPGWDVELYRGTSFIAGTTVDEAGRYQFERVPLFAGDNRFRIVTYGTEGQETEDTRLITVLPNLVGNIKGHYNASISQKDTITYRANAPENPDEGSLRFSGIYDRRAGDNLTLRGGLHSRETFGQRDNYFYTGAVTSLYDAIINADLVTTSDGPFQAGLSARKRFDKTNATAGLDYISENFSESFILDTTVRNAQQSGYVTLNGPFMPTTLDRVTYDARSRLTHIDTGQMIGLNEFGLSSRFMGINFDNSLSLYTSRGGEESSERDTVLTYNLGVAGRLHGYSWRSRFDYEVSPAAEPNTFNLNVNKQFTPQLSGFTDLRHVFQSNLSTTTVGATYYGSKARVSPQVRYDSDNNLQAKVTVGFGLSKDPHGHGVVMTSRPTSDKGTVSVLAFLDKAGDGVFSEGDEPLQDVIINLVQFNKKLVTDAEGLAFSNAISTDRVTDIAMEENSSFDPTWVPGYDGASFRIRPAEVLHFEFPVLRGAEMDGTAYVSQEDREAVAARNIDIKLVTPDGVIAKSTSTPFDGFYVMGAIRPGVYYLTTDSSPSPYRAYRMPEKLVITPEGAQIYGKNITLTRGYNIPFRFSAANANPALERRTKILKPEDIAREDVYIRLGNYRSSLAASLAWYKLKLQTRSWNNKLTPTATDFDTVARDEKTGRLPLLLKPAKPLRMEEAALLCERLVDAGFGDCGVDVVTTYYDGQEAAATDAPPVKG